MWPWVVIGTLSLVLFPILSATGAAGSPPVNGMPSSHVSGTIIIEQPAPSGHETSSELTVENLPIRTEERLGGPVVINDRGEVVRSIKGSSAYPRMMSTILSGHPWLIGLLVAAFLAAFLSTVDTLLNWGSSYLVHDVFRRFVRPDASEKQLLFFAKVSVLLIMVASVIVSRLYTSIGDAWIFTWSVSAGLGPVVILRWFWWRINAWCEIGALALSLLFAFGFEAMNAIHAASNEVAYKFAAKTTIVGSVQLEVWHKAIIIVFGSLLWCIYAAFFTKKTDQSRLESFVRLVRPPGRWAPIRKHLGASCDPDLSVKAIALRWVLGVLFVYGCTFALGGLIYGHSKTIQFSLVAALIGGAGIWMSFRAERANGQKLKE
jgi:hypothetical protein